MEFPITATKYDYVNAFVNTIAPIVVNEYLSRKMNNNKTLLPSVVIAMACQESGYNINSNSLFGIKGEGFYSPTIEYIDGVETSIVDSFRMYPTASEAVVGLYDLMQWAHYDSATEKRNNHLQAFAVQQCGYATDPNYAISIISIMDDWNLSIYDDYAVNRISEIKYADYVDNTTPDAPKESDSYTVQAGDNLWQIVARRYQLDDNAEIYRKEMEIAKLNNIDNPSLIYTGMVINFN
jgi:lysozyme